MIRILLFLVFCLLQAKLWLSEDGLWLVTKQSQQIVQQEVKNQVLQDKIKQINKDIDHMKNNKDWIEDEAREQHGLIRKGETLYINQR